MRYLPFITKLFTTLTIIGSFLFLAILPVQALNRDEVFRLIEERKQSLGLTKVLAKNIHTGKLNILPIRIVERLPHIFVLFTPPQEQLLPVQSPEPTPYPVFAGGGSESIPVLSSPSSTPHTSITITIGSSNDAIPNPSLVPSPTPSTLETGVASSNQVVVSSMPASDTTIEVATSTPSPQ